MVPWAVLDTNVLVSGLLTPAGPSARLMDLAQRGELVLVYDDRMLHEYADVLHRSRFGFSSSAVATFLEFIEMEGQHVVARPFPPMGIDPSDQPFLEAAISAEADLLVTGNRKHYPLHPPAGLKIVTPADAMKRLV